MEVKTTVTIDGKEITSTTVIPAGGWPACIAHEGGDVLPLTDGGDEPAAVRLLKEMCKKKEERIRELADQRDEARKERDKARLECGKGNGTLMAKNVDLTQEIEDLDQEMKNPDAKTKIRDVVVTARLLKELCKTKQERIHELTNQRDEAREQRDEARLERDKGNRVLMTKNADLEQEIRALKQECEAWKQKYEEALGLIRGMGLRNEREVIYELTKQRDEAREQRDKARYERDNWGLMSECEVIHELAKQRDEAMEQRDERDSGNRTLMKKNEDLEQECQRWKNGHAEVVEEKEKLEKDGMEAISALVTVLQQCIARHEMEMAAMNKVNGGNKNPE